MVVGGRGNHEPTIETLADSWERSLRAERKAKLTIRNYVDSPKMLCAFLRSRNLPIEISQVTKQHIELYMAHLNETQMASSAETRFRRLRSFFDWCEAEEEIEVSPMLRMKPPKVPVQPSRVLTEVELRKLFTDMGGKEFSDRRDLALTRLYFDTGC